jgi:hypothetical protein
MQRRSARPRQPLPSEPSVPFLSELGRRPHRHAEDGSDLMQMPVTAYERVGPGGHREVDEHLIMGITTTWRVALLRDIRELRIRDIITEKLIPVVVIQSKPGIGKDPNQLLQSLPTDNRNDRTAGPGVAKPRNMSP